jgi:hypothetical protein
LAVDEYRARRTVFEKESAFRLQDGALIRGVEGLDVQRIAFTEVAEVALTYQPLTMVDRWVCSIRGAGGRIWLPSASFTGVGRAEDRRTSFRPFAQALSAAIAAQPAAGKIWFVKGNNWSAYGALALLIVLAIMAVLLALGMAGSMMDGKGVGGASWVFLPALAVLWSARMVWRIWRRNRRCAFDPKSFPADFASAA